jgi:hypothetical protein
MRKSVGQAPTAGEHNKNRVGRLPTLERNRKIILSDEVRRRMERVNTYRSFTTSFSVAVRQFLQFDYFEHRGFFSEWYRMLLD